MFGNKKGQSVGGMNFLIVFGLSLLVFGLIMSYGAQINEDVKDDFAAGSVEASIAENTSEGLQNAASKQGTLGNIGVAIVIIGLLISGFGGLMRLRG